MSRNLGALIGALIGAIVGTIDNLAHHSGVDDSINWYLEGVGHAVPWLLIGALMGFLSGRSSWPKKI
jgi:hypothetical protein